MKRIALLFVLLMVAANAMFARFGNFPNSNPPQRIKGGYRYLSLYVYGSFYNGLDTSSKTLIYKNIYDTKGRVLEESYIDPSGCYPFRYNFSYDENGNVLSKLLSKDKYSPFYLKETYTYNSDGKVAAEQHSLSDAHSTRQIYVSYHTTDKLDSVIVYTNSVNIISKKYFTYYLGGYQSDEIKIDSNGWQYYTNTEKFDAKGNLLQHIEYKADGSIRWTTCYIYNTNNKQTEERSYDCNGYSTSRHTYRYDAQGNEIERITYNPDKSVDAFTYQYNMRRKGKKRVQYYPETATDLTNENSSSYNHYLDSRPRNGAIESKRLYRYNKQGLLLEESLFDAKGGIESHILYSYDIYGNCAGYVEYDASNKPTRKTEFVYSK